MRVRITAIPSGVRRQANDPLHSHRMFQIAVGRDYEVRGLNLVGDYELWLTDSGDDDPTCGNHTIWIEPECTESVPEERHENETIYVRLLDEGTEVWRPVQATKTDSNDYMICRSQSVPDDESWEFLPGQQVSVCLRRFQDRTEHRVATAPH